MRKLTLIPIFQESSFTIIEKLLGKELPENMVAFLRAYGGRGVRESILVQRHPKLKSYSINNYLPPWEINTILQKWAGEYPEILPFAISGSGAYFCCHLDNKSPGTISIAFNKGEDGLRFKPVSESLEAFVEALVTPDEFKKICFN